MCIRDRWKEGWWKEWTPQIVLGANDPSTNDILGKMCIRDSYTSEAMCCAKEWWMVNEDGIYHDRFYKLTAMIAMEEVDFLENYSSGEYKETSRYEELKKQCSTMIDAIPDLPFSNLWSAQTAYKHIPCLLYTSRCV